MGYWDGEKGLSSPGCGGGGGLGSIGLGHDVLVGFPALGQATFDKVGEFGVWLESLGLHSRPLWDPSHRFRPVPANATVPTPSK